MLMDIPPGFACVPVSLSRWFGEQPSLRVHMLAAAVPPEWFHRPKPEKEVSEDELCV